MKIFLLSVIGSYCYCYCSCYYGLQLHVTSFVIPNPSTFQHVNIHTRVNTDVNVHTNVNRITKQERISSSLFSTSSSSPQSTKYKVLFQKVIRPPPQLTNNEDSESEADAEVDSNSNSNSNNQLLLFLPSLIHYLQSTFTLPRNLPMIYNIIVPDEDTNEDTDGNASNANDSSSSNANDNTYSILEIKSPLSSKDDVRFHLYVEVIGIYANAKSSSSQEVDFPSMAMIVVKTKEESGSGGNSGSRGNDVIRQRLFQDSIDKIIKSLDSGLDSYAYGKVPLLDMEDNTNTNTNSNSNIEKDNDNGEWMGLEEYEGLSDNDSWEDLEPLLSSKRGHDLSSSSWDEDGVIDTVATSDNDNDSDNIDDDNHTDDDDHDDHDHSHHRIVSIDLESGETVTEGSLAKSRAEAEAATKKAATTTSPSSSDEEENTKKVSIDLESGETITEGSLVEEAAAETTKKTTTTTTSSPSSTDFAVQAAQKAMEERKRKEKAQKQKEEQEKSTISGGDFAVEAAKRAAAAAKEKSPDKDDKSSSSSPIPIPISKTVTSTTKPMTKNQPLPSEEPQITQGDNLNLEDMLPDLSPMITRGMGGHSDDSNSNSFRFSISNPKAFTSKKNKINRIKNEIKNQMKKEAEQGDDPSTFSSSSSTSSPSSPSSPSGNDGGNGMKRKKINIVKDHTMMNPDNTSEKERQSVMNNLSFQSLRQSSTTPSTLSSMSTPVNNEDSQTFSRKEITKTQAEMEQDVYKAALNIMPGYSDEEDGKAIENGDISAEDLLKDILKFGEEQEREEADGAGFADGALKKAKELMSFEQNQQPQNLEVGYKEPITKSSLSSEEEELKRIFAAGQQIADGRISLSSATTSSETENVNNGKLAQEKSIVTDEYVDELIDSDKTVPRNARSLDEELAELELRISRNPGEELDQGTNALFDIFSGPETYNPNVDPETAVNWPGAMPGTRTDVNLPPELETAVKNARFASSLLSKIIEEEDNISSESDNDKKKFFVDGKEISKDQISKLQTCVEEGVAVGLIVDPYEYLREKSRLDMVIFELRQQPEERFGEIITNYKDLLLSDNFITVLKEKLRSMAKTEMEWKENGKATDELVAAHALEREILGKMVQFTQLLLKEVRALGAALEASQLQVVRSICQVAMDPSHETEEETAIALTDAVRDMKPLLDENFVAYLKYAIAEEEGRLARAGYLDDPEYNRWLFVLKIVQEGVYAELSKGVQRYIDHIEYVLRMETKLERRMLLSELIDAMPSMDVRPFVKVVDNIALSLGAETKGDFGNASIGSMANKVLQLRRDVHDLLPSHRIKTMSKDADDWAAKQKEKLMEQRGVSQQRLKAARESEQYDEVIQRGEVERFD